MVQDALHKDKSDLAITVNELLHDVGVSPDSYAESIKVTSRGPTVVLRRSPCDAYTNSCNPDILRLWGVNVDLQYVTNEVATVMYVCSYMTKGEKAMGETLKRVSKECRNDDMRTQMNKIKKEFLGKRVIGAPESCMRVLSLWLMKKSRKVIYVNSNMKHEHVSLPKTRAQLEKMHPDDDDVFATSIIDRYMARPRDLADMCLALFAVTYDVVSGFNQDVNEDMDDGTSREEKPSIIKLRNGLGRMRKRKRQSILRVKRFKLATDPERYYHSKLILYFPWAREEDLLDGFPSYHASYHSKLIVIQPNADMFNDDCDAFDISPEEAENERNDNTVWDLVAPSIAQDDALTNENGFSTLQDNVEEEQSDTIGRNIPNNSPSDIQSRLYSQAASKQSMLLREYCEHIRHLNEEQRRIVMFNRQWCKSFVHQQRLGRKQDGYKVFLSGCGGTGKSHVVRLIQRDTAYLLQHALQPDPDQPIVLVTAPTGSAAFNINGSTVHSALSINDRSKVGIPYEKQCLMQVKLEHLMLLVTDEISMIGFELFQRMNEVICSIKRSVTGDWGGICVLVVGDLFQLPPVAAAPVYMAPRSARTLNDLAPNGWEDFKLHELTEVMRQKDLRFINALHNIRICQPLDGSPEDQLLRGCELACTPEDANYPHNAMHVYAQNTYCDEWNEYMLSRLEGATITCIAVDSRKDTATNMANINISEKPRDTGNLRRTLRLKIGAKVMLTSNIDVSDGLTNGTTGTVTHVVGNDEGLPHIILVHFECSGVGENARRASPFKHISACSVPIHKGQATFTIRGRKSCQASRTQFPLTLAWAVTIHKCQGLTLPEIVVDMSPKKGKFSGGQAYVAFSRVRELAKLHIVNYSRTQIRVSEYAEEEMNRLRQATLVCMSDNIFSAGPSDISLLHINICNITRKMADLACDQLLQMANIVSINETHLTKNDSLEPSMLGLSQNFSVFRQDRDSTGGGVALFVNKTLNPTPVKIHLPIEAVAVRIHSPLPMIFLSVYRPPVTSMKIFSQLLKQCLHAMGDESVCIVGDFNEDILLTDKKPCCSMLKSLNYTQLVTKPTCDSGTLIDHVYINAQLNIDCDVADCYYSDHDFVLCKISAIA